MILHIQYLLIQSIVMTIADCYYGHKLISIIMADAYAQLFRELYQKKYTQTQHPRNCIDRVKQIQRKIKQSASLNKMSKSLHLYQTKDRICSAEQLASQENTKIIRFTLQRPIKAQNTNYLHVFAPQVKARQFQIPMRGAETANYSRRNVSQGVNQRPVPQSHRFNRPSTQLTAQNRVKPHLHGQEFNKLSPFSVLTCRNYLKKKQRAPGLTIAITGQNLPEEAAEKIQYISKMDDKSSILGQKSEQRELRDSMEIKFIRNRRKIAKYDNNQRQNLTGRQKISQNPNSDRIRQNSDRHRVSNGRKRSKGSYFGVKKEREDNLQLLPWSQVPQHEMY